jgi:hypothetical protein
MPDRLSERPSPGCGPMLLAAMALFLAQPGTAGAAGGAGLRVELNKLETLENACRIYLVVDNAAPSSLAALELDLVLFGRDGVILRRLAVDLAPLRAEKRSVKLFDVGDLACAELGSLLVNDITTCADGAGPIADCAERLETASRAAVTFSE